MCCDWSATGMAITPHYERAWYLEIVAGVKEATCVTTTMDAFGRIRGGHIVLDAPSLEARLHEDMSGDMALVNPNDPDGSCRLFPDSYSRVYLPAANEIVYCMGIEIDLRPSHVSGFKCIVVRASAESGEYFRISQTNCPKRWTERAEKRTIKNTRRACARDR